MGGETPIKCLAVKSKDGQLEDWEYTPEPLKSGDVGETPAVACSQTALEMNCRGVLTCGLQSADVRVLYNGLCHSDLHVWRENWGPCPFPMVRSA